MLADVGQRDVGDGEVQVGDAGDQDQRDQDQLGAIRGAAGLSPAVCASGHLEADSLMLSSLASSLPNDVAC